MRISMGAGAGLADVPGVKPGYSLPRAFYTDPAIFEQDLERMLLRHWFCAGHVSSLPARRATSSSSIWAENR
jgi:phenylpropionate dioxygenase-like ring-hydroxylating dioxygenase large terminal subunit